MILYHGTNNLFRKFDSSKSRIRNDNYGGGIYFTPTKKAAMVYAKSMAKKSGIPYIYSVKCDFKKTFDVNDNFSGKELTQLLPIDVEKFARGANLLTLKSDKYEVIDSLKSGKTELSGDVVFRGLSNGNSSTTVAKEILMKNGYDSIRYNGNLGDHDVYIAYNDNVNIEKIEKLQARVNEDYIDRSKMPQIDSKNIPKTLEYLVKNSLTNKKEIVPAGKLIPMQRINQEKVTAMLDKNLDDKAVIVSKKYEIVDGHHRWAVALQKGEILKVIRINGSFDSIRNCLLNYKETFFRSFNESADVSLLIHSCFGNEITISINNIRYSYFFDGNIDDIYKKVKKLSLYSSGKAIEFLKKRSMSYVKEDCVYKNGINRILEEVFYGI